MQRDEGRWPGDARSDRELQGAPSPSLMSRACLTPPAAMPGEAQRGERLAWGHRAAFPFSLSEGSPPSAPLPLILASQRLPSLQAAPPDAWLPWCRMRGGFLRSIQKYTPARPSFLTPSFQCQSLLLCGQGQGPFLPQQPRSEGGQGGRGSRK